MELSKDKLRKIIKEEIQKLNELEIKLKEKNFNEARNFFVELRKNAYQNKELKNLANEGLNIFEKLKKFIDK